MPSTAPDTRASTAVIRNGTSTQVGKMTASAPMGSCAMASASDASEPASRRPKTMSTTVATEPPNVFQKMIAPSEVSRRW